MHQINASIVLYHNKKEQLAKAIESFLNTDLDVKLYLVDNSSNNELKDLKSIDSRIEYIFNNANLGSGDLDSIMVINGGVIQFTDSDRENFTVKNIQMKK